MLVPYIIVLLLPVFFYVMFVYIRAALRRRMGSRFNTVGFLGFFVTVIYEILYYTGFVPVGGLVSFGLLFFLLTQLLNLSLMFTRAVTQSERLSVELNFVIESQEETIRQRTASLQALNLQLEQGNQELLRLETMRSAMLAEVHHDLSTPITAIKGFAKAIKTGVLSEKEAPVYAGRIYERSLMLEKLIDNVVELSQLKTGDVRLELVEVPLLPFVRQLCARYAAETSAEEVTLIEEERHVSLVALPPGEELLVRLDLFRFERVFANLIANAVKYSSREGMIRVWVEFRQASVADSREAEIGEADSAEAIGDAADRSDAISSGAIGGGASRGEAILHVSDTGIGIPESELTRIFEWRYQSPGVRQAGKGSGLGLAICLEIVHLHQGEISVSSKPGEGSDFFIVLPARIGTSPFSSLEGGDYGNQPIADRRRS
ncbi:sensor histidine kinase [Paenibacillus koleovorans]|uniref:sensor histidine kinase n=1 Tax=Paenibacillus koleovorans TaxID=121608 RepID=UPI000FDC371D|nr:sensor histidine kinase [Paenibacillus koleovorans]